MASDMPTTFDHTAGSLPLPMCVCTRTTCAEGADSGERALVAEERASVAAEEEGKGGSSARRNMQGERYSPSVGAVNELT